MKIKESFSAKLSLGILAVTSVIFIITIGISAFFSQKILVEEATKSAESLRDATVANIEKILKDVEISVIASSWLVKENISNEEYLYHITHKLVEENPNIVGSAIAFEKNYFPGKYYFSPYSYLDAGTGEVISKQLGNKQYDYFYMDWYQIPSLLEGPCWGEPYYDEGGGEYMMATYSYPLKDDEGKVFAVMTADISLFWISEMLAGIKPYPNSNVMLISRNGSYISQGSKTDLTGETIFSTLYYTEDGDGRLEKVAQALSEGKKESMQYRQGTEISFAVFAPLDNGWKACITCGYREILSRLDQMRLIVFILSIFGILVLFIVSYVAIRRMTQPLLEFSKSVMNIAKGDFNTTLPEIQSEDEIKKLRDSFEYMQTSLKEYISELKTTTAANQKFESELSIANAIQMAMLTKNFPHTDRVDAFALVQPAREVGGDLYDFFIEKDRYLYFAVGDVSGKGVPASLVMAITRASFRFIAKMGLSMEEVVGKMNDTLSEGNDTGMFVTFFAGKIDLQTGEFEYCNAGHNPIVVISPDGKAEYLKPKPNLALGLFPQFPYVLEKGRVEKGSSLVLYTDGVTEAERADKEQFGEEQLIGWAGKYRGSYANADESCHQLLNEVKAFTAGNEPNDDITIMTIDLK